MKKAIYFIGLAFALLLAAASCQKEPFLTFNGQKSFTFKDTGGSETITFSCNRAWTAKSSESWVTVSPAQGDANEEGVRVTITCAANTTYDPRTATVTIVSEGLSESISISQETNHGLITSPTTLELTNAEQDIEIEVQKNVQYSVAIDKDCSDWISVGGTKALTTDKVTFHIAANPSYDDREGKITFKQIDGALSQTVTVRQSQTNGLFITTSEYDLSNEGHNLTVEVKANVEFEVTSQAEWIKFVETKALKASTISLAVDANESYDNRTGTVLVKQTNGDLAGTITVYQHQTDGLFVTPTEFELTNSQQTVEIEVEKNVSYSIVIPDDAKAWIAVAGSNQTKALEKEKITLNIAKNTTYDDREASVTIKQVDGSLAETVKIKQAYGEGLIIEKTEYVVGKDGGTIEVPIKANVDFDISISADWIKHIETKALRDSTICFAVEENTTYDERSAKIEFSQKGGNLSSTITVTQSQFDALFVEKNLFQFTSSGGQVELKFKTNVNADVVIPEEYRSWISSTETKALVDYVRYITVQPNDTYVDREAIIYVRDAKTSLQDSILIKESQLDYVQLCNKELTANKADTTVVMKVKYNIDFTPRPDADWISLSPASFTMEGTERGVDGLVEAELKVNIRKNPNYTYRVSHVTNDYGTAPSVSTVTQSPFGFIEFEGYTYKTVEYSGSEWFAENLRAKYGQTEGDIVNEYGYGTSYDRNVFWAEQDGELLYSLERMTVSDYLQGEKICPEGWHISTREDWRKVFSLGSSTNPGQFVRNELGGSDDFSFGANYGKWHVSTYWLEMGLCSLFQDCVTINHDEVVSAFEQRSANQSHYPSEVFRHIRCVRGPVAPLVQTLPVIKQTTTSAELRVGALNGPELAETFNLRYYDAHSKITNVVFKYGTSKDNLSSSISVQGANLCVEVSGLTPGTVYYYQPVVEYEGGNKPVYGDVMTFKTHDGILEYQGETYYTTVFNGVEWMAKNLQADKLNDGTPIPNIKESSEWSSTSSPAQCVFNNDDSMLGVYGRYYNKYVIDTDKICPEGWRLPTTNDFTQNWNNYGYWSAYFENYLCVADMNYYVNPVFGNNLSGFSALPSGIRLANEDPYSEKWGECRLKGYDFYIWTTCLFDTPRVGVIHIQNQMGVHENIEEYKYGVTNNTGCSVRCVREKQ